MFIVENNEGSVAMEPINNQLRISTYRGDEPGTVRLTADEAATLGSALLAFAERYKA